MVLGSYYSRKNALVPHCIYSITLANLMTCNRKHSSSAQKGGIEAQSILKCRTVEKEVETPGNLWEVPFCRYSAARFATDIATRLGLREVGSS